MFRPWLSSVMQRLVQYGVQLCIKLCTKRNITYFINNESVSIPAQHLQDQLGVCLSVEIQICLPNFLTIYSQPVPIQKRVALHVISSCATL